MVRCRDPSKAVELERTAAAGAAAAAAVAWLHFDVHLIKALEEDLYAHWNRVIASRLPCAST